MIITCVAATIIGVFSFSAPGGLPAQTVFKRGNIQVKAVVKDFVGINSYAVLTNGTRRLTLPLRCKVRAEVSPVNMFKMPKPKQLVNRKSFYRHIDGNRFYRHTKRYEDL